MPQLTHDFLREVFYEIANTDGFGSSMDKFMMAGKEPFQLVLDVCKKAKNVIFFEHDIYARLPNVHRELATDESDSDADEDDYVHGAPIPPKMKLFKPIFSAIASTLTSLDIRGFSSEMIPILKSFNQEMDEVIIRDYNEQLEDILDACSNISNVRNGVTIYFCQCLDDAVGMKSFAIPCRKLTMKRACLGYSFKEMNSYSYQLRRKIRDLTIKGIFFMTDKFHNELKDFAAFLSIHFSNVETLSVKFQLKNVVVRNFWNWNGIEEMANQFKCLPPRIQGCICFKIINPPRDEDDPTEYPGVQRGDNEYYKIVPITETLTFKLAYCYNV